MSSELRRRMLADLRIRNYATRTREKEREGAGGGEDPERTGRVRWKRRFAEAFPSLPERRFSPQDLILSV